MFCVVCLVDPLQRVHEPALISAKLTGALKCSPHMRSKVGVMYRIKLMRKNGTCRTEFARKSIPPTNLSSHVTLSKLIKKLRAHSDTLTVMICSGSRELASLSFTGVQTTHRDCNKNSDGDACTNSNCRLSVVLIFEEARVL